MMEIRKFLTCSASHLPPAFAARIESMDWTEWPVCGLRGPFGWFIYAHDEDSDYVGSEILPEVMAIFTFARQNGCDYVYVDQDAELIAGFPTFDDIDPRWMTAAAYR